jgi:uncharacterized membrane protein
MTIGKPHIQKGGGKMVEEQEKVQEAPEDREVKVKFEEWLTDGWKLYKDNLFPLIILAVIFAGVMALLSKTLIGPTILYGPVMCGVYYVVFEGLKGREMNVGDISKGFSVFLPAMLASIVVSIFTAFGFLLFFIPGLFVMAAYAFTFPLIIDRGMDFWEAMETSRKTVMERFISFTIFFCLVGLAGLSGSIILLIGVVVTLPFAFCTVAVAYKEVFGLKEEGSP